MDILDIFWTFYLNHLSPLQCYFFSDDLDQMTLILKLDLYMVKMYLHAKNESSKVIARTGRNTVRQTHRQTDMTENITYPYTRVVTRIHSSRNLYRTTGRVLYPGRSLSRGWCVSLSGGSVRKTPLPR